MGNRKFGRVLIGLSVVCLLLCHGAFGALHLIPDPLILPVPAGEHASSHSPDEERDATRNSGYPVQHHTGSEYFAVLLGFLVGVALLLLGHIRRWNQNYAPRFVGNAVLAVFTNLPRGPTTPFLQVFRL
ncbi:MAG: hypothetical protein M3305_16380 [Actinomycetota bacterium]|nr:hypothetical protein [Actinomycetota bacterium]